MDACDLAKDYQDREIELLLKNHHENKQELDYEDLYCVYCDDEIPEARRDAIPGVDACVECQAFNEHFQRHKALNK